MILLTRGLSCAAGCICARLSWYLILPRCVCPQAWMIPLRLCYATYSDLDREAPTWEHGVSHNRDLVEAWGEWLECGGGGLGVEAAWELLEVCEA